MKGGKFRPCLRRVGAAESPTPQSAPREFPPSSLPRLGLGLGTPKRFRVFWEPLQAPFPGAGVGVIAEGEGSLQPGRGQRGVSAILGGVSGAPHPWAGAGRSYVGSTARMRAAGLVSVSRSRFTGWILAWGRGGGRSAQPHCGGGGRGGVPKPPPHPAAHDVPDHGWRRVRLDSVFTGVGERHAVAGVEEGGPGGHVRAMWGMGG